jgi:hypothetical protein
MAIKVGSERGVRGIATVSYDNRKKRLLVDMDEGRYDILVEDAPGYLVRILIIQKTLALRVSLNSDGTQILSAGPVGGSYFAVFDRFTAREGEVPSPKMIPGGVRNKKGGGTWVAPDQLQFNAVFRVVSGKYAANTEEGCEVVYPVPYAFRPSMDEKDGMQIAGGGSKKLTEFLQVTGLDFVNDTIPVSDNCLPWLEKTLRDREIVVVLSLTDEGYVDTLAPAPEGVIRPTETVMTDEEDAPF